MGIPESWLSGPDASGSWVCWEETETEESFWVSFDLFESVQPTSALAMQNEAERMARNFIADYVPDDVRHKTKACFTPVDDGYIQRLTVAGVEDRFAVRIYGWHYFRAFPSHLAIVHFSLVIPEEIADRPDMVDLAEAMDKAVAEARIDATICDIH